MTATERFARGGAACKYLVVRHLRTNSELTRAGRYLGRDDVPQLPEGAKRSVKRAAWLALGMLALLPELLVVLFAIFGAPSAVLTGLLWPVDPGNFNMLGVGVDSWLDVAWLMPLQIALGLGMLGWVAPALARAHAKAVLKTLSPTPDQLEAARLSRRVEELTRTRAGAVDSHGAELRRIERDLHDGTQAQLVSLAMRIGVAKQVMADDPEKAAKLLDDARDGAEQAMHELRGVLRTMYPPILQDRGLDGAVAALCARCPLPVELRMGELGQVPAPVEAAAYFVVAESLTNVTKHSAAARVDLLMERRGSELYLEIVDDGIGGARINEQADLLGRGSGLHGMLHRVQAIDGRLELRSPIGGPTTIEVILPCE